jgi:hypothetical protein
MYGVGASLFPAQGALLTLQVTALNTNSCLQTMCLAVLALFAASVAATGGGELIVRPAAAQQQRQQHSSH